VDGIGSRSAELANVDAFLSRGRKKRTVIRQTRVNVRANKKKRCVARGFHARECRKRESPAERIAQASLRVGGTRGAKGKKKRGFVVTKERKLEGGRKKSKCRVGTLASENTNNKRYSFVGGGSILRGKRMSGYTQAVKQMGHNTSGTGMDNEHELLLKRRGK